MHYQEALGMLEWRHLKVSASCEVPNSDTMLWGTVRPVLQLGLGRQRGKPEVWAWMQMR